MFRNLLAALVATAMACCGSVSLSAQSDTTFIYLNTGGIDAFPAALVKSQTTSGSTRKITDITGKTYTYRNADVQRVSTTGPTDHPWLTSFKFNNKFNDQLYTDVEIDLSAGNTLRASIAGIGKWLKPSFKVSVPECEVYVGLKRQQSKISRQRFDSDVVYTAALPNRHVLRSFPIEDEQQQNTGDDTELIAITASDLSTNAPSNTAGQGVESLCDNNPSTYFHSTWNDGGELQPLPLTECPWIDIHLPSSEQFVKIYYMLRIDSSARSPLAWDILTSDDGQNWQLVRSFSQESDGLPTDAGSEWTSPTIDLGAPHRYIRLKLTAANYKNYLCLSELAVYRVKQNSAIDPQSGKQVECRMVALGTDYTVSLDFLTDHATQVPRIDIQLESGYERVYSKYYYIDATITIDGAGVFPDMAATPVHIKGRGNSTWDDNTYWSDPKNPYRLKFDEKVKPFGLNKGKNWVLLTNKISGSMTTNAVGMKAACIVGTDGANHIVPVELYINGNYRGNYNLTEKVGLANNSIELEDETGAALLELDTYKDSNEDFEYSTSNPDNFTYFNSATFTLPVHIKKPEFLEADANTELTPPDVRNHFNSLMSHISSGEDISQWVDVNSLARFYMVNDLILNLELMHPKSTFLYHPDMRQSDSLYHFGPVWDLDWAFGHELAQSTYYTTGADKPYLTAKSMEKNNFWKKLRACGETLDRAVYSVWYNFMEFGGIDELLDFCDDYYAYARPSLEHNATLWSDGRNYANTTSNSRRWLQQRAEYIYSTLTPYHDLQTAIERVGFEGERPTTPSTLPHPTTFDVYDIRGMCVRRHATYDNWRQGLAPGMYIIGGRKVLVK